MKTNTPVISSISRLNENHIKSAAVVLREAFAQYPVTQHLFAGAADGPDRFQVMFEYLINSRLVRNSPVFGCRVDGKLVGVAVVSEPGQGYTTPELDAQWEHAAAVLGEVALARFEHYGDVCDRTIPSGPYHYLGILGVTPDHQRQGIGRRLVGAVLEEVGNFPDSKGVCLNTETKKNLPFYEKSGFRVFDDTPVDSIHTWGMVWEKSR